MQLHAEADIRLVGTVGVHGLGIGHPVERLRKIPAEYIVEECLDHALESLQHIVALHEGHLAVYLGELRLTVGPQVLVPEAAHDLEIAVITGYHEQLLGALGQGVELTRIHTRRHHKVAGTLGSGLDQVRGLDLHESLAVKVIANLVGHAVTQHKVLFQRIAAQIEVAVLHPQVIAAVRLILDGKRRRGSRIEHVEGLQTYLHVARIHPGIPALTLLDSARNLYYIFAAQLLHLLVQLPGDRLVYYDLCDTVTVPQVDEAHAAHLPDSLDPAGQSHLLARILKAKLAACVCPVHNLSIIYGCKVRKNNLIEPARRLKVHTELETEHQPAVIAVGKKYVFEVNTRMEPL